MPDSPFDVVGVGINSVDRIAVVPHFPQPSGPRSKLRLSRYRAMCGGQTATALAACARLGLRAKYVGAVGRDADGAMVSKELAVAGVDVSSVVSRDAVNRFALVLVDEGTGGRAVLWDFDERLALSDDDLPTDALQAARLIHVDDVDVRAAIRAARIGRARGVPVTSDIDQVTGDTRELLDAVTVAIFAEHVPEQLAADVRRWSGDSANVGGPMTGRGPAASTSDAIRAALLTLPRREDQAFVVTLGERGALALDSDGFHHHPAFPVRAADTTGAGDVFRAGFIYALLRGWPRDEQLRFGNAAAAVSCTRIGAMASVPTLAEVEAILARGGGTNAKWGRG
ncbi:MAG: PfkB family carbohydrate kinase [Bacteroidales bacterium]